MRLSIIMIGILSTPSL